MSDIFAGLLNGQSSTIDNKKLKDHNLLETPVLLDHSQDEKPLIFLVDTYLKKDQLKVLSYFISSRKIFNYKILYALKMVLSENDLNKTIWRQYSNYAWDYENYISPYSKVICFGRSLFSLTHCNDLDCSIVSDDDSDSDNKKKKFSMVNGFYDTLLWKTHFYVSQYKFEVFPVDSFDDLWKEETGSIKDSFETWFLKKQIKLALDFKLKPKRYPAIKVIIIDSPNEWLELHKNDCDTIGIDIETGSKGHKKYSFDPWSKKSYIRCVTLCFYSNPYVAYYLRYNQIDTKVLNDFLVNKKCIGTNLKFDFKFLHLKAHIPLENLYIFADTIQNQQLCNQTHRKGLKSGSFLYTPYGGYDRELDEYIENHPEIEGNYGLIPEEVLYPYAGTDPAMSVLVYKEQLLYRNELDRIYNSNNKYGYSLKWIFEEIMVPALNMYLEMELQGLGVNQELLAQKSDELHKQIATLEIEILQELKETKETINIGSTDQLGKKLESLGWTIRDRSEKGFPKTGEAQLLDWKKDGHKLAEKILKYRELEKLNTTYVGTKEKQDGMYQWIREQDGMIHSLYGNFLAQSLRNTSNSPNGQNIPSHGSKATLVRSYLQPSLPGYDFVSTDAEGLQLRLTCISSNEENMRQILKFGDGDLHMKTAYGVFLKYIMKIPSYDEAKNLRKNGDEKTKESINEFRFKSKSINFGCIFGAKPITIMDQTVKPNWSEKECEDYIKANDLLALQEKTYENIKKGKMKGIRPSPDKFENICNAKYYTVSVDIRKKFFETYPGLEEWIENVRDFGKHYGYMSSCYGEIRRLPYLTFYNESPSQNRDIDYGKYSNYLNIILNTSIQTKEVICVTRNMLNIWKWSKKNNRKFIFFGQIHDAEEAFSPHDETLLDNVKAIHEISERDYPEYEGIPIKVESCVSDYWNKQENWDQGRKYKTKDLQSLKSDDIL